ncbi:MAG: amidohydrolase family protein, partial [Deltaproteobacteria bacterium]|nr:amidohydrolase family protein [Deltaproteobacteria bacterium]
RHSFAAWAEAMIAARDAATERQVADGLRVALQHCYKSGITCVGDHVSHASALPWLLQMPLRGRAFVEVFGPEAARARAARAEAEAAIERHRRAAKRMTLSATPHSAYALHPTILRDILTAYAQAETREPGAQPPLSIHCAETREEWECFTQCRGPLHSLVQQRGHHIATPSRSPIEFLERHGGLPRRGLFVHANYTDPADLIGLTTVGATIVHCPQSHRFFGADAFPMDAVRAAGIPVALGTDSLATAPTLNLFTEMQLVREQYPHIGAAEILRMATRHGAAALGLAATCGAIAPGLKADLIAIRCNDLARDPYETVLRSTEAPFVVIDGRIVRNVLKGEHQCRAEVRKCVSA